MEECGGGGREWLGGGARGPAPSSDRRSSTREGLNRPGAAVDRLESVMAVGSGGAQRLMKTVAASGCRRPEEERRQLGKRKRRGPGRGSRVVVTAAERGHWRRPTVWERRRRLHFGMEVVAVFQQRTGG
ncbi:hypothetical protein E2562_009750 [Oryza meyeriana var. granulata]|uniref:DUF834 domain-containing protein n=1 Tax=Oryza meyeriana var. granulata TaxID=110450 RepID=A0A6G1D1V0_9ORYZ|nr:hypothetical protein E2562_009750 [Oryza meyeriana var. granulata]